MTSNLQFAGMEASTCVFITNNIVEETGARSGLLRATARLVVVSYTKDVDLVEVRKRFIVPDTPTIRAVEKKEERRKREEERRKEVERLRKYQTLVSEVDIAAKKGDIARVKQLQQSETTGIVIIIITTLLLWCIIIIMNNILINLIAPTTRHTLAVGAEEQIRRRRV